MKPSLSFLGLPLLFPLFTLAAETPRSFSGIYPHLSYFNLENECGTGAVVPWADRLWVTTYGPHSPMGSSDKLYEITPDLQLITRPESVGGTHANRMIHEASQQLIIGPYFIDQKRNVRVIPPAKMPGRLTGTSQHLTDPEHQVYFATMEEGLYEVNVQSLAIKEFIQDGNGNKGKQVDQPSNLSSKLPGYHGKGLYTAQNRVIYANNGDRDPRVVTDPSTPSGALAEWTGEGDWKLVRRNQFTEVTSAAGIHPKQASNDPVWSLGWDHRSLILMCLDEGQWHQYRLPKGSHSYDGAHGWNTEWPRIRDIGQPNLLMTMHGNFWSFPREFSSKNSAGITPRSAYLKVIGDFTAWNDKIVFGCDDSAKSEFLNTRPAKGEIVGPSYSHSNLWFLDPKDLDHLGPVIGTGSFWVKDNVQAFQPSDPMLFSGYQQRGLLISHQDKDNVKFHLEIDEKGDGHWKKSSEVMVPSNKAIWVSFAPEEKGAWLRLRSSHEVESVTATFIGKNQDTRSTTPENLFQGLATEETKSVNEAYLYAGGKESPTLQVLVKAVPQGGGTKDVIYELPANLKFEKKEDVAAAAKLKQQLAVPQDVLQHEASSILLVDGKGRRFRFPKAPNYKHAKDSTPARICREVCTERDLFHAGGLFYELPAENADGFRQIRPIASHPYRITDYGSWRGLLVLTGIDTTATNQEHILKSEDNQCAVWLGAVDDLWKLGKPVGQGGPWLNTEVKAEEPSDAFLMHGFDKKTLTLSHKHTESVLMEIQINLGSDEWVSFKEITVAPNEVNTYEFPTGFNAKWIRFIAKTNSVVTAQLKYE